MRTLNFLALDLGAESGRGILGRFDGERLSLEELGRFATGRGDLDIAPDGVRRWDWARISMETDALVQKAIAQSPDGLQGVGADSWGVDFGLLNAQGQLLEPPVQYRDANHPVAKAALHARVPRAEIWAATGIQHLPFNTLCQLKAIQERDPNVLDRAAHLLMVPDLLHYQLTGGASVANEMTLASTTQFLSPTTKTWDVELLTRCGLPSHFLGPLTEAGALRGHTPEGVPVYAPATHDTAAAVAAVPADGRSKHWAFVSSGTWSLVGVERQEPILSLEAQELGLSNESGVGGTIRLLKNIMGLWMVQECRRSLRRAAGSREYSYAELTALAEAAPPNGSLVDAAAGRFLAPPDMVAEVQAACRESNQTAPQTVGEIIRCCLESLALAYRDTLGHLEALTGDTLDTLYIVGGGAQNRLLNQWTADACNRRVIAGPSEATAIGNLLSQLVGSGRVANWQEARLVSCRSAQPEEFLPAPSKSRK